MEAFPAGFFCEHRQDANQVFALVSYGRQSPVLVAVLKIADGGLAHRAACVFNALRESRPGPALGEEAADVERLLPEDQRPQFHMAVEQLIHRMWPKPPLSPRTIDEGPTDRFHSYEDEEERSPEDARLTELPGQVVRIWRLTELHVHDSDRVAHAATSTGRLTSRPPEGNAELLVASLAVLLDDENAIPGADKIYDEYLGSVLDPEEDELADYRPVAPPKFTTGLHADEPRWHSPRLAQ